MPTLLALVATLAVDAACSSSGVSSVLADPPSVASVQIAPSPVSLAAGASVQLTAAVLDAAGAALTGRTVSWTTGDATIAQVSGSGMLAALKAGSTTVTATSEGHAAQAVVSVTTTPAPPPPPPPAPSPTVDTIFADGFETGTLKTTYADIGAGNHVVVTDAAFAHGGSHYLDVTYPAGSEAAGWLTRFFMPGYDSIYVRAWVRESAGWKGWTKLVQLAGSRTDDQWSAMGQAGVCPTGTDFFLTMMVLQPGSGEPAPLNFYTYYPGIPHSGTTCYGTDGREAGATYFPPLTVTADSWHKLEFWVKLNTPGQSNGLQRIWLDGRLIGEWKNAVLRNSSILKLNSIMLTFSICCGGPPQQQHLYFDDVVVSSRMPVP
ncbi:MAG TPA: Ig-like domain-containing protein [Gemmatimonadaceae bacterium]|nr:Ig-like domain-containing protein [Gemmatimonadaceae bacterium]